MQDFPISIYGKRSQEEQEFIGKVDEDYYGLLKRHIRLKQAHDFDTNLKHLLYNSGWVYVPSSIKDPKEYLKTISVHTDTGPIGTVYSKLVNSRIPVPTLDKIIRAQLENPEYFTIVYKRLINKIGIFDLRDFLCEQITPYFYENLTNDVNLFIDATWNIKFTLAGNNIGSGEVCLTLLTGAIKADVGDLKLPDNSREVEIKGCNGKVGSQYYAEHAPKRLSNILDMECDEFQRKVMYEIDRKTEVEQKDKLWMLYRQKRCNIRDRIKLAAYKITHEISERETSGKSIKISTQRALDNLRVIKRFVWNIGKEDVPETGTGTGITIGELKSLKSMYDKIQQLKQTEFQTYKVPKDKKFTFPQAVKGFFLVDYIRLTPKQLIDGFFECRNHKLSTYHQEQLLDAIYQFFFYHTIDELRQRESLGRLMITIHTLCYWLDNKFTDIHFINDKTKSSLIIHLPDNNISLANAFEIIYTQVSFELKTNLSLGGQSPVGVEIYLEY